MSRCTRLEKSAYGLLILLAVVFMGAVTRDAWRMIGRPWTGFPVMENMLVGVGGTQRTAAEPFDLVRAVNGRLVGSSRELQREVERHPAGTRLRHLLVRSGSLVEEEIASRGMSLRDFKRFVIDNLLSGILVLGLGAVVALLQPGARTTRLFLAFCLTTVLVNVGYVDLAGTHRFTKLFFLAWTLWPALFAHLALAYAIVRYQLFDIRAMVRAGTVYSVVTATVALGYAGLLAGLNVLFARLDLAMSGVVAPLLVALVVVLLVNRVYTRTQALVDRLFFRERYNSGQALVRLADAMTTTLELDRLAALIAGTVDEILHPARVMLFLSDDERGAFRRVGGGDGLAAQAVLATCLAGRREPLSRETLLADPELEDLREACLADLDALEGEVAVPIGFRERLTALLVLGPRRGDVPYTSEGLRIP